LSSRGSVIVVLRAPANTTWTPGTKTLSTTALPNWATRLELWRQAPGGMPEQLAIGPVEALFVQVPVGITFATGVTYQLWLQARNSRGGERPGPEADVDGGVAGDGDEVWGLRSKFYLSFAIPHLGLFPPYLPSSRAYTLTLNES